MNDRVRVLIVEDEEDIRELVAFNLSRDGYQVLGAERGEDALRLLGSEAVDLVVLDLMLPGIDGLEVCRQMKRQKEFEDIPIVMLTARGEEADIVGGLEIGADDYVSKPFRARELRARIKAVLRRRRKPEAAEGEPIELHGIYLHPGKREVRVGGRGIELTFTEFEILHHLMGRPGWVFTRYQIVDRVRGQDYAVTDRSVDVQIVGLRKKLGSAGKYIETVRGVGYRFRD